MAVARCGGAAATDVSSQRAARLCDQGENRDKGLRRNDVSLGTILLIIIIIALVGGFSGLGGGYGYGYGHRSTGILGVILVIVLVLVLLGRI